MSSQPLLTDEPGPHCFDFGTSPSQAFLLPQLSVKHKNEIIAEKERGGKVWIVRWGYARVVDPFFVILRRGLEPKLLSLSVALGITLGLFPLFGAALLLCSISAMILQSRCHVPTLMLANFVVSPFELGMVLPFMRVGELITGADHLALSPGGFWEVIRGRESWALIIGILHAVIGWCVFAPICICFLYFASLPFFRCLISRSGSLHELTNHVDYIVVSPESASDCVNV